ncbi:hypothetical protein BZL54_11825 [Burkholderia ubonensis subsp. mesacidophila]|uniref:Uncharacterized protein n=1 Tax=Burkholderia ubonensis subsp. mesacidophila TaxID=265293 RepID=A0A2A4FFV1_9BURK|nr:hypothetical protein BZL54_11825 [Burkholderia ubonensis subsp. mesacidophila]
MLVLVVVDDPVSRAAVTVSAGCRRWQKALGLWLAARLPAHEERARRSRQRVEARLAHVRGKAPRHGPMRDT